MCRSRTKSYLLFRRDEKDVARMVDLLVNDCLNIKSDAFLDDNQTVSEPFISKPE